MSNAFARDPSWFIEAGNGRLAVGWLRDYFASYTGSRYEVIADHAHPNEITARDIVAVSMLGVDIPAPTSAWLLGDGAKDVAELLRQIPPGQTIWDPKVDFSLGGPAWPLWDLLRKSGWPTPQGGMGWTKTSKLLATKRPHLIPIYDSLVAAALYTEKRGNYWAAMRSRFQGESGEALQKLLDHVRAEAGVGEHLSLLRVLDIVVWMWAKHRPD